MKNIKEILIVSLAGLIVTIGVWATSAFPAALSNLADGDILEADVINKIEAKIGVNNSTVVSSLDYLAKNSSSTLYRITPTTGGLLYWGGSAWANLATSTSNKVLKIGSTGYPEWGTDADSGAATTTIDYWGSQRAGSDIGWAGGFNLDYDLDQHLSATSSPTFNGLTVSYLGSLTTSTITTLTATTITIGANSLTTSEWAKLDGVTGNVSFWANDAGYISSAYATSTYLPIASTTPYMITGLPNVPTSATITWASSTAATTTLLFAGLKDAHTITDIFCITDTGTSTMRFGDGTNWTEYQFCNPTGIEDDGTIANGAFTAREIRQLQIGSQSGSPMQVSVTITKIK